MSTIIELHDVKAGDRVLEALADAALATLAAGTGFGWLVPPPRTEMLAHYTRLAANPLERLLVAVSTADDSTTVQGSLRLVFPPPNDEAACYRGELCTFFVVPTARRRGVGRALLREAERLARAAAPPRTLQLNLDVRATQTGAIALYEGEGYIRWGTKPRYARTADGVFHDGHYYSKSLQPTAAAAAAAAADPPAAAAAPLPIQASLASRKIATLDPDAQPLPSPAPATDAAPEMELLFLGTASMMPTKTRNVSCTALRLGSKWWLFDCGEGTQHQTMKASRFSPGEVSRIFVTHLHGDHCFGLPGMLCKMGNTSGEPRLVEIVGPRGTRAYLRNALNASFTGLTYRYTVIELWPAADADDDSGGGGNVGGPRHFCEQPGPDVNLRASPADGTWPAIPSADTDVHGFSVAAAPLDHAPRVPCVGYVVTERNYPGGIDKAKLKAELLPRLQSKENRAFCAARGVKNPMQLLGRLKKGATITLCDGDVAPSDFVGPPRAGRKVTVMGDTCGSVAMAALCRGSDVLVHEATNAYLPDRIADGGGAGGGSAVARWGDGGGADAGEDEADAARRTAAKTIAHGHSTPAMAGRFAADTSCRRLCLTHFSGRYKGDDAPESRAVMAAIVAQAEEGTRVAGAALACVGAGSGGPNGGGAAKAACDVEVFAARDLWGFTLPLPKDRKAAVADGDDDGDAGAATAAARANLAALRAALAPQLDEEAASSVNQIASEKVHDNCNCCCANDG